MAQVNLISWCKTNKMYDMLVYDGFMYQKCKKNVDDDHYKCCLARVASTHCKSSLNLSKDETHVTRPPTAHNHPRPIQAAPIIKRLRNNIKVRVMAETKNKPYTILLEEVGKACRDEGLQINTETAKLIPNFKQMSRTLYTLRSQEKPSEPVDTDDIDLTDDKYILTNDMKRYKLFDTLDAQRMICYSSNVGLEILSKSKEWHADGTFKSAPRKYKQVYHIHAWLNGHMYLCAKIFLKNKDELSYDRMLQLLKSNALDAGFDLKPDKVTVDFEQAAINSFKNVFNCIVKGKFNHLNF